MSIITPPLKYPGGKHYLAARIVGLMPAHVHYVEPFFGGGAVLLARNPEGTSEVANDLNRQLWAFWTVLQSPWLFADFLRKVQAVPFSEDEYRDAAGWQEVFASRPGATNMVERAASFFIACRQSLAGRMQDFAPLSKNRTRRGMNEQASAWMAAVDGLPEVHARLRRVAILNRPASEVIAGQDAPGTLFYCDPPYLHETRSTTGEYLHEMTAADHEDLLRQLAGIRGKFMLSGYDSPLYRRYEKRFRWHRREFDLPNNAAGGAAKRRMTEVLWMNFDPAGGSR